jgi:hypothetical protein
VTPGVEVRSSGDITLDQDWNLMPSTPRIGEAPTVTLRAAGNLIVAASLTDGFASALANAQVRGEGGSLRLIGGADLGSADVMATQADVDAGNVTIGRGPEFGFGVPPSVFVRSTTGTIDIAAAGDIEQLNSQARIYTTGLALDESEVPGFEQISFFTPMLGPRSLFSLSPFFVDAGDISLAAGRDVLGSPGTVYDEFGNPAETQYVTDWWFRHLGTDVGSTNNLATVFWSRYDLFAQGVASFGGGDISVAAGRDIANLEVSTPSAGYALQATDTQPAQQRWFEGGSLDVQAGRDVVSGLFNAGGPSAHLQAQGSIVGATDSAFAGPHPATQLFYMNTAWTVNADGSIALAAPVNTAHVAGTAQGLGSGAGPRGNRVSGLAPDASADVASTAGDVAIANSRPTSVGGDRASSTDPANNVLPDELRVAAPLGGITVESVYQQPVGAAALTLLAEGDVDIGVFRVTAGRSAEPAAPQHTVPAEFVELFDPTLALWHQASTDPNDVGPRDPVRLVSTQGSVDLARGSSYSARPLRVLAEKDIVLHSDLQIEHLPPTSAGDVGGPSDLSLLQAGRDMRFVDPARIRLSGPGDLVVAAGRDIDFGSAGGIVSVGNQDNPRVLPEGGANITLLAGVRLGTADYSSAVADDFQHLGGARFDEHAAVLAVYFGALAAGTAPDAPTSAAARSAAAQFRQLGLEQQLAQAQTLAGQPAFEQAVTAAMRLRPGNATLGTAQALQAFAALSTAERTPMLQGLVGSLLAGMTSGWSATQRSAFASDITHARLIDFVELHTGARGLDAAAADSRFAALAPERQSLLLNEVLFAELRAAGRSASALAGAERDAAYKKGYDAIAALFPGSRPVGAIDLSGSQAKTQQGGDIHLVTPGGGVNVGELGSSGVSKAASELGIVTVAGGRVEGMVRDNFDVNQSRVFTLQRGDLLLWSSEGNLDAGRGAKTVTGAPAPVYTIDETGAVVVDTSGSFSGSGIAVLDAASSLDLYAPKGEINAGDAGIRASGNAYFGAVRIVGADNLAVGGLATGAPPPVSTAGLSSGLTSLGQAATAAGSRSADTQDEDDERKKRRARRNLLLDFLGFGSGD